MPIRILAIAKEPQIKDKILAEYFSGASDSVHVGQGSSSALHDLEKKELKGKFPDAKASCSHEGTCNEEILNQLCLSPS